RPVRLLASATVKRLLGKAAPAVPAFSLRSKVACTVLVLACGVGVVAAAVVAGVSFVAVVGGGVCVVLGLPPAGLPPPELPPPPVKGVAAPPDPWPAAALAPAWFGALPLMPSPANGPAWCAPALAPSAASAAV